MTCCASLLGADKRTILGAIIAGGQSTRFGSDKAMARLDGRPLIEHVAQKLGAQSAELVVVGHAYDGLRDIDDAPAPGMGPLGGIAAALIEARRLGYSAVLTAPCDAVGLPDDLPQRLYPPSAYVESLPVIGLWSTSAADQALAMLSGTGSHAMKAFVTRISARPVKLPREPANINTTADLERVERHGL